MLIEKQIEIIKISNKLFQNSKPAPNDFMGVLEQINIEEILQEYKQTKQC